LKRAIYVDYENVSLGGLAGIEKLTGDDLVQIFIGSKSQKLSMEDADRIFNCEAEIEVITNKYIGKNALDFIIMVHMGHDIALNVAKEYYIISKDKGYDPAIHEMRKMSGLTVSRRNEITSVADEKNTIGKKIMGIFGIGKDKGPEEPDTTEHTFVKGKGKNKKPLVTNKQTDGQKAEDGIKSDYEKPHADDDRQQVDFSKKKQRPRKSNQSAKAFNSNNGSQLEKKQTEKGKQLEKAHNSDNGSQLERKQTEKGKQLEKAHNSDNGSQLEKKQTEKGKQLEKAHNSDNGSQLEKKHDEKTFSSELGNQSAENHQIAKSKKSKKKRTISKKTVDNLTDKNEADNSQNSDKKSEKAKQATDKPVEKTKQANDKPVEKTKKPAVKKQAEKSQQPATKKQAEKPQQPAAKKQAEKPQQPATKKQAEKPQQSAAKKQAEKPQQSATKKQAEKPQQPATKKQVEKPQQQAAKKQAEKPQQPATKKQAEKPQQQATKKQAEKLQQSDSDNVTKRAQKPKKKSRPAKRQADNSKLESIKNADNKAFSTKESSVSSEVAGVLNEADKQQRYEDHKQAMMKAAQQNQSSKVSITPQQEKKPDNSLQPELSPEELERKKSRDEAFALLAMLDEEENSRPKFVYKRK
jgi:hypothetical protein